MGDNPINFIDPYGLYRAQTPNPGGSMGNSFPWGNDIPFGAYTSNNTGMYYPGWTRDVGLSFEEYMFSKGYYYGINQYGTGTWISGDDITVYTGSPYYLSGILEAALSGGIAGVDAYIDDYWTRFYDLLANSASLGDSEKGYGMMFDGDPKKKENNHKFNLTKSDIEGLLGINGGLIVLGTAGSLADFPLAIVIARVGSSVVSTLSWLDCYGDYLENPSDIAKARLLCNSANYILGNAIKWYWPVGMAFSLRDIYGKNDNFYKKLANR